MVSGYHIHRDTELTPAKCLSIRSIEIAIFRTKKTPKKKSDQIAMKFCKMVDTVRKSHHRKFQLDRFT